MKESTERMVTDLTRWEGRMDVLYCDLCGKPWMECMEKRHGWMQFIWPDYADGDWPPEKFMTKKGICPGGKPTWGVGCRMDIFEDGDDVAIDALLVSRMRVAKDAVRAEFGDSLNGISEARYTVLLNMAFNGGRGIFKKFPRFVVEFEDGMYDNAALELKYVDCAEDPDKYTALYTKHPDRWAEMCRRLVTGEFEEAE